MNTKSVLFGFVLGIAVLMAGHAVSQEEESVGPHDPTGMDPAEMMQRWQEARTPGKQHAELAKMIGEWEFEMSVDMGGGAMVSKGTAKIEWLIEGLFLGNRGSGTMMGMPYETFAITGFDNFRKHHVTAAVDSMNSHILRMEGTRDREGAIHYWGRMDEPTTGEVGKMVRSTVKHISDDEFTMDVYDHSMSPGEESKVVSFRYKRKGS